MYNNCVTRLPHSVRLRNAMRRERRSEGRGEGPGPRPSPCHSFRPTCLTLLHRCVASVESLHLCCRPQRKKIDLEPQCVQLHQILNRSPTSVCTLKPWCVDRSPTSGCPTSVCQQISSLSISAWNLSISSPASSVLLSCF